MTRLTPRRLWTHVGRRLRFRACLRALGGGRTRPEIPAHVRRWALVLGQLLREVSFHAAEARVRP